MQPEHHMDYLEDEAKTTEYVNFLREHLEPKDVDVVTNAYKFAVKHHEGALRKDKGDPVLYIRHPEAVTRILIEEIGNTQPELVASALMHDLIEDTDVVTRQHIAEMFGEEIADIVDQLTNKSEQYVQQMLEKNNWKVLLVKACDILNNIRDLKKADEKFQRFYWKKVDNKYMVILDQLVDSVPEPFKQKAEILRAEVQQILDDYRRQFAS